jgi:hypothetical protein
LNSLITGKRLFFLFPFILITLYGFGRLEFAPTSAQPASGSSKVYIPIAAYKISQPISSNPGKSSTSSLPITGTAISEPPALGVSEPAVSQFMPTLTAPWLTPTLEEVSTALVSPEISQANLPSLDEFIRQVADGQTNIVRGLYVSGLLALQIVQQPQGNAAFISREAGTVTEFQSAALYGVVGLLAHNFLSGQDFFSLKPGQELDLVYGDGTIQRYQVSEIKDFQRLSVTDLRSNFQELASNQVWTANQVFAEFYQKAHSLTLQTCIERDGNLSWGVRMILAEPVQASP